jgi:transcriptional regulator of nitric oxide reductase
MRRLNKLMPIALLLYCAPPVLVAAQKPIAGFIDPMPTAKLKQLFPKAVAFTTRCEVDPLHFTAYASDPAKPGARPIGFAFWTIDLVPLELGYHGHIHMLIGMDMRGRIAGVMTDINTEPYGDISVNLPEFPNQFKGKSIRDKFVVGEDLDAVSRATITVRAAAREIRESSRIVARALLTPDAVR